jgi:hypothetical protein
LVELAGFHAGVSVYEWGLAIRIAICALSGTLAAETWRRATHAKVCALFLVGSMGAASTDLVALLAVSPEQRVVKRAGEANLLIFYAIAALAS